MQTSPDRSYVELNARELTRLRGLVERLSDEELLKPVNEFWTVAGVLAHIAFWDARALVLAGKIERGIPFTASDIEPDDVTWINDSARRLIEAIPPREAARLALDVAEEIDARVAALDPASVWPNDPQSLLNARRAEHRAEHLDEIEPALQR